MSHSVFEYYFDPEELGPHFFEFADRAESQIIPCSNANEEEKPGRNQPDTKPRPVPEIVDKNRFCEVNQVRESANGSYRLYARATPASSQHHINVYGHLSTTGPPKTLRSIYDNLNFDVESDLKESDTSCDSSRTRIRDFLSVHALGQYVFCKRAGILAAESEDAIDADDPLPRLTFLPNFDLERIEEALSTHLNRGGLGLVYISSMVMLLIVGVAKQSQLIVSSMLILLSVILVWEFCIVVTVFRLIARRRKAIKAEAKCPDPSVTELRQINWWSMLNAGFAPANYQRPFRHPKLPLEGCPWRVLERDSLRIPVIRAGGDRLGNRKGELFPKYRARIIAYAVLLEATNHVKVPYGLIFPQDSPHGLAIPIADDDRAWIDKTLDDFANAITASNRKQLHPALPELRSRCEGCSFGKPEPITMREIEQRQKSGADLIVLHNNRGDNFECKCSNRFGTVPPHKETKSRRLVASIQ